MNYIPVILGALIGVCLFFVPIWCYRRGLKDGLALNQGKSIEPIQNPIQAIQRHVEERKESAEAKKENDLISEGLANIMNYDGTPQKIKEVKT
jgi:hypothetical protein